MNSISTVVYRKEKHQSKPHPISRHKTKNHKKRERETIELSGNVISGRGEGALYLSHKEYLKQFQSKVKYTPYHGTLNVKIDSIKDSKALKHIEGFGHHEISGFKKKGKSFGGVKCFEATLNNSIPCHVIRLEKTHHDVSVVELISKYNIRNIADISDESRVKIDIESDLN